MRNHGNGGHIEEKSRKLPLDEQVEVPVAAAVRAPVVLLEVLDQRNKQSLEYGIGFCRHENFAFAQLLRVDILVNGQESTMFFE